MCVCVCVMSVEREGVQMPEFEGQNSCDHFETVLHAPTRSMASTTEWRYGAFELRPETEEGTNRQTKTSPTVYRSHSNTRDSGGVGNDFFFGGGCDFSKKEENNFEKSGK